jgi:hypothetical protein
MRSWSEASGFNRIQVDAPGAAWNTTAMLKPKNQSNVEERDEGTA